MAELAFEIERIHMGVAGGWQDQYAAAFGGINFIEFSDIRNEVSSLKLEYETLQELQESLILCNSNLSHQSGDVHKSQKLSMQSEAVRGLVARNVDLTYDMKHQLVKGNLDQLGRSLNTAWSFKRQFDPSISSKYLDKIYDGAMENGASGGKLLGAGGGGYFLFFVTPFMRQKLIKFLNSEGLSVSPVVFDEAGITSWKFRSFEPMEK
jgi:D-glycero-alpha-D-manno-heptose-7-phosphate kinase